MFSVVLPAFNCERTIEKALQSVVAQTRKDLIREIIVINDGSTDRTEDIIKGFIRNNGSIDVIYEYQFNRGASAARNRGIRIASSDWIALLDSDDIWLPNKIERQASIINSIPDMFFLGSQYPIKFFLKKYTEGLHKLTAKQLCIRSMPTTPSVVFNREIGLKLGLFNEKMRYCEDINFFQKFLLKDSYYVLAENLVEISIEKHYTGQSGVSSNLKEMAHGRDINTKEMAAMGLISKGYMSLMLAMNKIKYVKRKIQCAVSSLIYHYHQ